jgi:glycosyltransferase involved in cell wall biosynthesis
VITVTQSGVAFREKARPRVHLKAASTDRVRVLHVIQNLNYGGMERLLADIVRGLDRSRFEAHVLVLQYFGRFADGLEEIAQLHQAPPMSRWSMIRPAALARQVARIAPHVVHTHSGVWYKASLAARMAGVERIIHTEHGRQSPDPLSYRAIDSLAARRTDVVVAVSEPLRNQLVATRVASARRMRVVQNGVDTNSFSPRPDDGALRREIGVDEHVPIIGSIGRLEQIKGYDVMIEAFARLLSTWTEDRKPVLVLAGEGSHREQLERMIRQRGITPHVHLLGWRNDAHALHAGFTLFTMSSRSEGTSVSLLEAMSAGLCPVVTNVGGNADVLGAELAHRLTPTEDPNALAAAWLEALRDRVTRAGDAAAARVRVQREFSLSAMIHAYERLYASALGEAVQ